MLPVPSLNNNDISYLLAGSRGLNMLSPVGASTGMDALTSVANGSDSFFTALLLRQQAEDRRNALFAQQLALRSAPPPQDDLLSLLIRRKQLETLQNISASSSLNQLLPLLAGGGAPSVGSLPALGQQPDQLERLARLLRSQSSPSALPAAISTVPGLNAPPSGLVGKDRKRKGRTGTFPQKLHQILQELQQEGASDVASFLPHGRAFAIYKPRDFVERIMPRFFRMSRFSSFQRQLNLYDFQRIADGPDKGAYYHELFVREQPVLSTMMKRNKIKGVKTNNGHNSSDEHSHGDNNSAAHTNDEEEN